VPIPVLTQRLLKLSVAYGIFSFTLGSTVQADSVKPLDYGPFFMNQLSSTLSPTGSDYILNTALYHFQVGWIEPISEEKKGLFRETYFESCANFNLSPFTSDIGTTLNLKPIRYLEFGLSYNRLIFHNTLAAFNKSETNPLPLEEAKPSNILALESRQPGGADVFTFQTNLTMDLGPIQFFIYGSRTLWDIDAPGKEFVYEYGTDILIRTRDRVNSLLTQFTWDLRPHSLYKYVTFTGVSFRDQYWHTTQTRLEKNLVSGGITGFRIGKNPEHQRRGLDFSLGYFTQHNQIPKGDWLQSLVVIGDWKWNIQFLKI
jgi:hypothetical protein